MMCSRPILGLARTSAAAPAGAGAGAAAAPPVLMLVVVELPAAAAALVVVVAAAAPVPGVQHGTQSDRTAAPEIGLLLAGFEPATAAPAWPGPAQQPWTTAAPPALAETPAAACLIPTPPMTVLRPVGLSPTPVAPLAAVTLLL